MEMLTLWSLLNFLYLYKNLLLTLDTLSLPISFFLCTVACTSSGLIYEVILLFTGIPCILSCTYRTKLRSQYGLIESPAPDWVIHCFCEWCALCQEYRELHLRGLDPSIGISTSNLILLYFYHLKYKVAWSIVSWSLSINHEHRPPFYGFRNYSCHSSKIYGLFFIDRMARKSGTETEHAATTSYYGPSSSPSHDGLINLQKLSIYIVLLSKFCSVF